MDFENEFPATHVRQRHDDLAVEASRPQQCGVQYVRTVGGGNDDDALAALEPVHLDQHLVQGLLALVVTTAKSRTTMATDCVEFVNEYDARRLFLGLVEHVTDA